tara:strand:+ start:1053 stop:2018 length:966 start_codon:yes stop_codon:yes gene_type:complete
MLLTLINEKPNSIEEFSSTVEDLSLILWAVHSSDDSLVTKNEVLRTAYFYRLFGKIEDPIYNVAYNTGMNLHRFMWMASSTLSGTHGVVIIKPGVAISMKHRIKMIEYITEVQPDYDNQDYKPWGIIKGDHDKYFVLNPKYSHVYKSEDIDEIVECCKANDLKVITNEEWGYDAPTYDLNYKKHTLDDFKPYFERPDQTVRLLSFKQKRNLTAHQTKNIVYLKSYENSITSLLDKFENSASFSTVDEFKDMLDKFSNDTTWILGDFLIEMPVYYTLPFNELLFIIAKLLSLPNSIVWAKLYHTPEEIHSTLAIHNKGWNTK